MQQNQSKPQIDAMNLTNIKDQMNREMLAYKKCDLYSQQVSNPQIKQLVSTIGQHHKQHFTNLYNYLNSHN